MSIIRTVKQFFESDSDTVQLFSCNACSNLFTKSGEIPETEDIACPNCDSSDVEVAVE